MKDAKQIRIGDLIVCHDRKTREVESVERGCWEGEIAFRFMFTDEKWMQVPLDGRVSVGEAR